MKLQPFAQHVEALKLREHRHQVLSSNIANADTPHYKARDIDFAQALRQAQAPDARLQRTSERHIGGWNAGRPGGAELKYRLPTQPALDGNTVEADVEQAAYAENAIRYRATLGFLDSSIKTIRYAIKGGE